MATVITCSGCKFWVAKGVFKKEGECHRYPPAPVYTGGGGMLVAGSTPSFWPATSKDDFCGEAQLKG